MTRRLKTTKPCQRGAVNRRCHSKPLTHFRGGGYGAHTKTRYHCDEARVQVLTEQDPDATSQSWILGKASGPPERLWHCFATPPVELVCSLIIAAN